MEKQFLLRIPVELHRQLKINAAKQGMTLHQLIISILDGYFKKDCC